MSRAKLLPTKTTIKGITAAQVPLWGKEPGDSPSIASGDH